MMRSRWSLPLVMLSALLAGCITDPLDGEPRALAPDGTLDGDWPTLRTGAPTADEHERHTLASPPDLYLGQWWDVSFRHERTQYENDVRLVVAGADNGTYHIGMSAETYDPTTLVVHLPLLGDLGRASLSYGVHEKTFEPLRFPLTAGTEWETSWQNDADIVQAQVTDIDEATQRATIDMIGPTRLIHLTYDARIGYPTSMEIEGYGNFRVTDHGYNHHGTVIVPHGHTPVILESRINGAFGNGNQPDAPRDTITVQGDHDEVSLLLMGGPTAASAPGLYGSKATAPDGTVFEFLRTTSDNVHPARQFYYHDTVAGDWQLEFTVGGPGFAFVEAIAYARGVYELS